MDLVPDWQLWKLKSVFVHRLNGQTTPQATPVLQPPVPDHTIAPLQSHFFLALRVASPGRGKEMQSWSIGASGLLCLQGWVSFTWYPPLFGIWGPSCDHPTLKAKA